MRDILKGKRPFSHTKQITLIVLILLAFWLRLHNIDAFSFWTDEGLTPYRSGFSIAEILSNRIIIQEGITNDTHPAFYFLIIHITRQLIGVTDFAFRFPSTIAGVLLVPVMFQFGRKLQDEWLGFVAALLTAVNPIYLWYANEARMYTLVVLLMAVASYVLWEAISYQVSGISNQKEPITDDRMPITRHLILYILFAGLALYTHYFSVFIIAGQALFWVWILWQRGQKRLILGTAVLGILVAIPLTPYTVPRLFGGTEANFFYVPPHVILQDVVRFFGPGNFVDFKQLFIQFLTIGFGLLLLLGILTVDSWQKRNFLLIYLFAIIIGISVGSLIKPIYQGPRHILAGSPAYILLISWAIVWLWAELGKRLSVISNRIPFTDYRLLITLLLAIMVTAIPLTSSAIAINNLYNDPHYAKDSLRDAVRFVERMAGERDVIVYNNAILLPLHGHYKTRDDVAFTASPHYISLAENTAAPQLAQLAKYYERIWFITDPPADKRDRWHLVEKWLNDNTVLVDDYPFVAKDTRLSAIVFDTGEQVMDSLPETAVSLNYQWPNTPTLQGYQLTDAQPINTPTFWVSLYWQGAHPGDMRVRFILIGPDNQEWVRDDYELITYPENADHWQEDKINHYSYPVRLPVGLAPATYTLMMQPYTDAGAQGDFQPLTELTIADSSAWADVGKRPFSSYQSIHFTNGLALKGIDLADDEVRPGHALPLSFVWESSNKSLGLQNVTYNLIVRKEDGTVIKEVEGRPGPGWLETWPIHTPFREPAGLYFPPETEPGRYVLEWQLMEGEAIVKGRPFLRPWTTETVRFGEVNVVPWPLATELPENVNLVQAQFGESILLYGYILSESAHSLELLLTWQTLSAPSDNYTIFIHLVDENGNIVQQRDIVPVEGLRPTAGWRADEILSDFHNLPIPDGLSDGTYALRIGLYNPDTFVRLPIIYQGTQQANDQLEITTITKP